MGGCDAVGSLRKQARRGKGTRRQVGARGDSGKDDDDCDMYMDLARMCEVQIGKIIMTIKVTMALATPTIKLTTTAMYS